MSFSAMARQVDLSDEGLALGSLDFGFDDDDEEWESEEQ